MVGSEQEGHNPTKKFLCLADEAFKEVLKDKIKQEIEKTSGAKIAALAHAIAQANLRKHGTIIQAKLACKDFETEIYSLLADLVK